MNARIPLSAVLALALLAAPAAQRDGDLLGAPPVRAFDPAVHGRHPQVWGAARDARGAVWTISSGEEIARFDGRRWDRFPTETQWLDIATTSDGRVWFGGVRAIGELDTSVDPPIVRPLTEQLPAAARSFRACHQIVPLGREALFVCLGMVLHFDGTQFRGFALPGDRRLPWAGALHDRLWLWRPGVGLEVLEGGAWQPFADGGEWRDVQLRGFAPLAHGGVAALTESGDVLHFGSDGRVSLRASLRARWRELNVAEATVAADGCWLVGTLEHGLVVVDVDGTARARVTAADGLPSDGVMRVDPVAADEVWLGTDFGAAVVDPNASVTSVGRGQGLRGQPRCVHRDQRHLWIGTTTGLYRAAVATGDRLAFERVPGPRGCWDILAFDGGLLCLGSARLWWLSPDGCEPLDEIDASVGLRLSERDGALIAGRGGLWWIRPRDGRWVCTPCREIDHAVWDLAEAGGGRIWITSDEVVAALRLDRDSGAVQVDARWHSGVSTPSLVRRPGIDPLVLVGHRVFAAASAADADALRLRPVDALDGPEGDVGPDWIGMIEDPIGARWLLAADGLWRAIDGDLRRVWDLGRHPLGFLALLADPVDPQWLWVVSQDELRLCRTTALRPPRAPRQIELVLPRADPASWVAPADIELGLQPFEVDADGPAEVRWRVAGVSATWRAAPSEDPWLAERFPAGTHRIEVQVWAPRRGVIATAAREFAVLAPWWGRPPAVALWFACAAAALAIGYRGASAALRRRNAELNRMVEVRTAELAAQSHRAETSASWARATFERSPVALFELDGHGLADPDTRERPWAARVESLRLRAANRAALDLAATADLDRFGRWLRGVFQEDAAPSAAAFAALRDGEAGVEFACRARRATGALLQLRFRVTVAAGARSRLERLLCSAVDETERHEREAERRQIEARIRDAQRLQGIAALAGGLAHDFNNLMTAVRGNADFLRARAPADGDPEFAEALMSIETAAAHAGDLCEQMLTFAGRGRSRADRVDPAQVIDEMVGVARGRVPRTIAIEADVDRSLPPIVGDRVQLGQVLMNLVGNAAEAIGAAPGRIAVRCATRELTAALSVVGGEELPAGRYVEIEVRDDGHGIEPAVLARVFEPFFTTRFHGRGLGLAAVLGIVRGHRGGITVVSELGVGTTVRVLLPAAVGPLSAPPPEPPVRPARARWAVAVCDDDDAVRTATRRMLEIEGHRVVSFATGEDLLAHLRSRTAGRFDVALLDWIMPGISGRELLAAVRAAAPELPVLLVSGLRDVAEESSAAIPAVDFLGKPFSRAALAAKLDAFVDARRPDPTD